MMPRWDRIRAFEGIIKMIESRINDIDKLFKVFRRNFPLKKWIAAMDFRLNRLENYKFNEYEISEEWISDNDKLDYVIPLDPIDEKLHHEDHLKPVEDWIMVNEMRIEEILQKIDPNYQRRKLNVSV